MLHASRQLRAWDVWEGERSWSLTMFTVLQLDNFLAARGASQKLGKIGPQPADSTCATARKTTYTTGC